MNEDIIKILSNLPKYILINCAEILIKKKNAITKYQKEFNKMSKIVSWNVNSIRKGIDAELKSLINNESPDIICFQETKCTGSAGELYFEDNTVLEEYPYRYWNDSIKGQAGVSTWCKKKPLSVLMEIPRIFHLKEGRVIITEFEDLTILNTYVPNTGRGEIAEDSRKIWHNGLIAWLADQFEKDKTLIWCGDLNVVSEPAIDTSHHKVRPKKPIAGLKEFEKNHFDEYVELGLTDAFRSLYPDKISYTWFSPRNQHVGWRLDYFMVNDISKVKNVVHNLKLSSTVSDHTWIMLTLDS
jgi:exodeoxyribonuclease-3